MREGRTPVERPSMLCTPPYSENSHNAGRVAFGSSISPSVGHSQATMRSSVRTAIYPLESSAEPVSRVRYRM